MDGQADRRTEEDGEVGMTIQRMLELLEIEHECMLRGSHDDCDRNCANCDLVQDDGELHEMYTDVIALLKEQEAVEPNEQKPPLGVKPYYIAAWQRIGELIEAIERQYESADGDAGLVEKWANEISWQASMIEALRGGQDEQPK